MATLSPDEHDPAPSRPLHAIQDRDLAAVRDRLRALGRAICQANDTPGFPRHSIRAADACYSRASELLDCFDARAADAEITIGRQSLARS